MKRVELIDTSVFLYFVGIRMETKDRAELNLALRGLKERVDESTILILPKATIFETLQHIYRVQDGSLRRTASQKFCELLGNSVRRTAPWELLGMDWNEEFLNQLILGAGSTPSLPDILTANLHEPGDILLLHEAKILAKKYPRGMYSIGIWTFDERLHHAAEEMLA